jgi:chemotaxis protein MotB
MQDALTKKDSVTLAVVTSLKSAVGLNDPDIEINVEKELFYLLLINYYLKAEVTK